MHLCLMSFADALIHWYKEEGRDLPWRNTKDPYIIWLSEVILQQTRVEQGKPYFYKFLEQFPTIKCFALAEEEDVLRMWQGLGYYSRARNMYKAAKMVMDKFAGVFPSRYEDLIALPGIGEYTAAAISSFSINEDRAVLDGNVFRVLSRYFSIQEPINTGSGKKVFQELAGELLPIGRAGVYNQAIMDYGAMVCKPKSPLCEICVINSTCLGLKEDLLLQLPVKQKGKKSRNRYFHYFIIEHENSIMMSKRGVGDIWANLYEFPMIESVDDVEISELTELPEFQHYFGNSIIEPIGGPIKHTLSHQNIYAKFYKIADATSINEKKDCWNYCLSEKIDTLAKHKLIFYFIDMHIVN